MMEHLLDAEELAAIAAAIRESRGKPARPVSPATPAAVSPEEVVPLALIADDRAAETARPGGLRIAERWCAVVRQRLRHHFSGELEVVTLGAEVVDGAAVREELASMWLAAVSLADRAGAALLAIGGPIVESMAARRLGARQIDDIADRPPSAAALRVFAPVGAGLAEAFARAWAEDGNCEVVASASPERVDLVRRQLVEADVLIALTIAFSGAASGRARILARPGTLLPPRPAVRAIPAPPGAIEEALGEVSVEVSVDLGRARLTMAEVSRLHVGMVIPLPTFVDDLLPVHCAGVVKAHGRAVVSRGALAVQIEGPETISKGERAA
jgi:flagellar motor switch protein FliM